MKQSDFESLKRGMAQAQDYLDGQRAGFVVHEPVNVKAVRAKTRLSQDKFARIYGLEVAALRDWEQGRRTPDRAAQTLFTIIDRDPEAVARLLAG